MALPGDPLLDGQQVPDHAPIEKDDNKGHGYQPVVSSKNPAEENKAEQQVDDPAGANVIGFSRDDPGQKSRDEGPIDKDFEGDRPIEIKQGEHQHKKRNGIVIQVLDVAVNERREENAPKP